MILLVIDISEPISVIEKKLAVCLETIERIEASSIPLITVLNKIDLLTEMEIQQKLESLKEKAPNSIPISALRKTNLNLLKQKILGMLRNYVHASFTIPLTSKTMSIISWLFKSADVQSIKYIDNSAHVVFEASPGLAEKIRKHIEAANGKFEKNQTLK
jgi:GTP-binding protein HflX